MPDETTTTQAPEGLTTEQVGSQAQEANGQPSSQAQNGTSTQVESGTMQPVRDEVRPFERVAGRKFDKLEKGMSQVMEMLQKMQQPQAAPSQTPATAEEFLSDPMNVLNRILDEREKKIKGEIPKTLSDQNRELENQRSRQEALKMIDTNELIRKDPEGRDRITDILTDEQFGLDKIASTHPVEAARLALALYEKNYGKVKSVGMPTKQQMGGTPTAVRSGAKATLKDEAAELQKQYLANPELINNPEFKKKFAELKSRRQAELAV